MWNETRVNRLQESQVQMEIIINSTLIVECLDDRGFTDLNVAEIQFKDPQ